MEALRLLGGQMELIVAISRNSPNDDVKTPNDSNTKQDCGSKSHSPIFHFLIQVCQTAPAAMTNPPIHKTG